MIVLVFLFGVVIGQLSMFFLAWFGSMPKVRDKQVPKPNSSGRTFDSGW